MQCDTEVKWGPGTADHEDTNTRLSVLPHRPLEVLLTSLWCGAESSEQSVVPNPTHKHIIRTETAVCAHKRGSGTTQHDSRHVVTAARTEGAALSTIRPSTQLVIVAPLLDPARVPHLSPTAQLLTHQVVAGRVEL